jgi:hypothetical protein
LLKKPYLDKNDPKIYCQVLGFPFISKIIEKWLLSKFKFLIGNTHNLHNFYQSAYKDGHSTKTALL